MSLPELFGRLSLSANRPKIRNRETRPREVPRWHPYENARRASGKSPRRPSNNSPRQPPDSPRRASDKPFRHRRTPRSSAEGQRERRLTPEEHRMNWEPSPRRPSHNAHRGVLHAPIPIRPQQQPLPPRQRRPSNDAQQPRGEERRERRRSLDQARALVSRMASYASLRRSSASAAFREPEWNNRRERTPSRNRSPRAVSPRRQTPRRSPSAAGPAHREQDRPVFPGYVFDAEMNTGGMSLSLTRIKRVRDGKLFVEKRTAPEFPGRDMYFENELKVLALVAPYRHPHLNLMQAHMWANNNTSLKFVLGYCDKGSLGDEIRNYQIRRQAFSEVYLWRVLGHINSGLAFLHHGVRDAINGDRTHDPNWDTITHSDLKPGNVFLTSEGVQENELPRVVIGDFGCSVFDSDFESGRAKRHAYGGPGTRGWDAPEWQHHFTYRNDLYASGLIIHAMALLTLSPDAKWVESKYPCSNNYSSELNRLVYRLLSPNPDERPDSTAVVREARMYARL